MFEDFIEVNNQINRTKKHQLQNITIDAFLYFLLNFIAFIQNQKDSLQQERLL